MEGYFAFSDILERHGGTVEKYIGDAVVAVCRWRTRTTRCAAAAPLCC